MLKKSLQICWKAASYVDSLNLSLLLSLHLVVVFQNKIILYWLTGACSRPVVRDADVLVEVDAADPHHDVVQAVHARPEDMRGGKRRMWMFGGEIRVTFSGFWGCLWLKTNLIYLSPCFTLDDLLTHGMLTPLSSQVLGTINQHVSGFIAYWWTDW